MEKKKCRIVAISGAAIVLIALLSAYLYGSRLLGKIHYSDGVASGAAAANDSAASGDSPQSEIDRLEMQIETNLESSSIPIAYEKDVFHVLLIGTDNRADVSGSRSDSMILISINKKTSRIIMTSFMRDIYLSIPGHGNNRLNAAYAYGGADLLMKTIRQNFKIGVNQYVQVDFDSFIDIIDKLGGVQIDVSDAELPILNGYVEEINELKGLPEDDGILLQPGSGLTLTGKQALGYSRIRYVGNGDYQRTERQRTVMMQMSSKLKDQNIIQLNSILNRLLPDLTTNLSKGETFSLLLSVPAYEKYSVIQDRIPIDGSQTDMIIRHMDVLGIDLNENIAELQAKIYG